MKQPPKSNILKKLQHPIKESQELEPSENYIKRKQK